MVKSIKSVLQCHEPHIVLLDTIKRVTGVSALHTVLKHPCNTKKQNSHMYLLIPWSGCCLYHSWRGLNGLCSSPCWEWQREKRRLEKSAVSRSGDPEPRTRLLCHRLSGWLSCLIHWMLMIWDLIVLLLMGAPLYCREVNIRWGVKGKAEIIR